MVFDQVIYTEKSTFLVFGKKHTKRKIEDDLKSNPLTLYGREMKRENFIKYLGNFLADDSVANSADETVMKRKAIVVKTISEIKTVVEDKRSHTVGGIVSGITLWETVAIPFLLHNACNWFSLNKQTLDVLDQLQNDAYRALMNCYGGCPLVLLY